MEYCIWIKGDPVYVSEEVYRVYWRGVRKERYFLESDIHNKTFSYDALDTPEMNGSDIFCDPFGKPVEEQVISHMENEELIHGLKLLGEEELELIRRLYLYDESLRSIARQKRVAPSTLQYRHQQILLKLKKYLLKNGGSRYE